MIESLSLIAAMFLIRWIINKCPSRDKDRVSQAWLKNHFNTEGKSGEDGVCWSWPINKIHNENRLWNRYIKSKYKFHN